MQIHTLIADDEKIHVRFTHDGKKQQLRDDSRDPKLTHALQQLKTLLIDSCEIYETDNNPVIVTQLRLGMNKSGGYCFVCGYRRLRRGRHLLETPRLKRARLHDRDDRAIERLITLAQAWIEDHYEEETNPEDIITLEMLQEEERAFLEEFA